MDMRRTFLLASDFDQTLSFNDSGVVLSDLVGFHGFHDKVKGLADINLVQQGAELCYLILHDPDLRRVRREHLVEAGRRIRLKMLIFTLRCDRRKICQRPSSSIHLITGGRKW
jgi:hypothetical protein